MIGYSCRLATSLEGGPALVIRAAICCSDGSAASWILTALHSIVCLYRLRAPLPAPPLASLFVVSVAGS